jgi:uncharacterized protein YcbX
MSTLIITGLYIYPVKSMKGIALKRAQLTAKGLLNDRLWMVVSSSGRFVTQRDKPRMALIETSLNDSGVVLSMHGHGSITIPFDIRDAEPVETRVWKDTCETVDQGDDISDWLTQALATKAPLRLHRMKPGFKRPLSKAALLGEDTTTNFADGTPFLIANEASLEKLNSVLESNAITAVPMNRFRPNIVVKGAEPFAEHQLASLSTENYQLKLCYPCERCIITTINQDTAEKNPQGQPFKTLQRINPMPGKPNAPAFAENAVLTHGKLQKIAVGDHLQAVFK